ncbi:sugar-binding protein [Neobacillus niacini]|uniref:sugar-binding protein n=1 Tax=Neobacillus niacini TaxID=86668 RepID=UPI003B022AD8
MSRLTVVAYTFGVLFFLVGCAFSVFYGYKVMSHDLPEEDRNIEDYKYHFVLVPEELDNDYWRLVEKGAQEAAKDYGVLLEYAGPKQANIDEHLKTIEMSMAAKVDGIMTQGLSDEQFTPLINKVVERVPVITIDTDAANSNRIAYIGTDNYYSGYLAGKALIEDTKGQANVAIITGSFYANHQQLRVQGFQDAVKSEQGIKIITVEESEISRVRAAEKAYQILKDYPEVNAFYGTSALDGIGIAQVVDKYKKNDTIYIIGFDTLPETLDYISKGIIEATVAQEPYEMGYRGIQMMISLIEGKSVPPIVHTNTRILRAADMPLSHLGGQEAGY